VSRKSAENRKEQKEILLNVLFDWMKTGGASQIDDVIVIGVRI